MRPLYRFTLDHDTLGPQVISEPEGWKNIELNLERDLEFHSLIENFEVPLTFYGSDGQDDGGYDYLRSVRAIGIDELVRITIEAKFEDDGIYELVFEGLIDISEAKGIEFRKIQAPIIRDDIWSKFMNRMKTEVNLMSNESLDGVSVTPPTKIDLDLPSQIIQKQAYVERDLTTTMITEINSGNKTRYYLPDRTAALISELGDHFTYGDQISATAPIDSFFFYFEIQDEGQAVLAIRERVKVRLRRVGGGGSDSLKVDAILKIRRSNGTIDTFTQNLINVAFVPTGNYDSGFFNIVFDQTWSAKPGDEVYFYYEFVYTNQPVSTNFDLIFDSPYTHYIQIIGDTIYKDSQAEFIQIGAAAKSIINQIVDQDDSLDSDYLLTNSSCGYEFVLSKGKHIRGYLFADRPFTLSFDEWWAGANNLFNLGLGYKDSDTSPGKSIIEIGPKAEFYDDSSSSVTLSNINNIEDSNDTSLYVKTLELGFEKWEAESFVGMDDPQTRKSYRTRFKIFGKDLKLLSKFVAASSAIEQTRRNGVEKGADWRLDEETFIIATKSNATEVELINESPPTITGLLAPETRYNVRLTPIRSLLRWLNLFNGQLKDYAGEKIYFTSGEGNLSMTWDGDACDAGEYSEGSDVTATSDHLFEPVVYSFTHPLSWEEYKAIRNNKKKSITIEWIHRGVEYSMVAFIKKLNYSINQGRGKFEVWIKPSTSP